MYFTNVFCRNDDSRENPENHENVNEVEARRNEEKMEEE